LRSREKTKGREYPCQWNDSTTGDKKEEQDGEREERRKKVLIETLVSMRKDFSHSLTTTKIKSLVNA
jgi:hypothetical protein